MGSDPFEDQCGGLKTPGHHPKGSGNNVMGQHSKKGSVMWTGYMMLR